MNLFWSTRALTQEREDHLTEFIAAALELSTPFREAYLSLLLSGCNHKNLAGNSIERVETQVAFPGTTCCPDMVLHLSNGDMIVCEHKLDAVETLGPSGDPRGQLKRYLDLPIQGLGYFRTCWKPPDRVVLDDQKYIRPASREHFLWRDLYPLLEDSNDPFLAWMREGFERLGFTPPHPSVGEMSGPDTDVNRRNRKNFAKLWGATRSLARGLGWKVKADSIVELYLSDNASSIAAWIFISPAKADRFLIRVTPRNDNLDTVAENLRIAAAGMADAIEVSQHSVRRKEGQVGVVDVITTLSDVLGSDPVTTDGMERRLCDFVEPFLRAI